MTMPWGPRSTQPAYDPEVLPAREFGVVAANSFEGKHADGGERGGAVHPWPELLTNYDGAI